MESMKFFALRRRGHVMSAKALKEVKSSSCLVWHADVLDSDKIVINGTEEEVGLLREKMEKAKAREKKTTSKKSNNGVAVVVAETETKVVKRQMDDASVNVNGVTAKKFDATKEVYASLFTSSKKKSDFRETYSCRSLPLGRN
ncbi:unnamed protein product [Cochlearia groenlandica]